MSPAQDAIDRFLRAARRRRLAWGIVEAAAVGAATGAAAASVVRLVGAWNGTTAGIGLDVLLLACGAAAGAAVGWTRRPGTLSVAIDADRQLGLADLLSTAWSSRDATGAMADAVRATAAARLAGVSPAELVLRRLRVRGWATSGAMVALLLVTMAIGSTPLSRAARPTDPATDSREVTPGGRATPSLLSPGLDPRSTREPDRRVPGATGDDRPRAANATAAKPGGNDGVSGAAAGGGGLGTTERPRAEATISRGPSDANANGAAADTAAGGASSASPGVGAVRSGLAGVTPAARVPAWQTPAWRGAREAAGLAVERGDVPDAYRSVVRDYFDPAR